MMRLIPETITCFPGKPQRFTLLAPPPPMLWGALVNANVNADASLTPINVANAYQGYGAQKLASGLGSMSLTLTANCLPVGAGDVGANLQDGSGKFLAWNYAASLSQLTISNQAGTITTVSGVRSIGDVLTIEAAGSVWRVLLNGAVAGSMSATTVVYPCFFAVGTTPPHPAAPKIPSPVLAGDWSSIGEAEWTATGGTITSPGVTATYTPGTAPGIYEVKATYAASALQAAVARVEIPTLTLAEPNPTTLFSGQTIRFRTNYPDDLVTWSAAVGNGTFGAPNQTYTAPTLPGTYTVKATSGSQEVTLTVVVPFAVAPEQPVAAPSDVVTFTSNDPTATYTASGGTMVGNLWTVPNFVGSTCTITVTTATTEKQLTARILEAFPYFPTLGYEAEDAATVLVRKAEDGVRKGRVKSARQRAYDLLFQNRELAEFQAALAFWERHYPASVFLFRDKVLNLDAAAYFDSALKHQANGDCDLSYSFRIVTL
jgi:hypothetical protein